MTAVVPNAPATRLLMAVGLLLLAVLATAPRVPYGWDAAATWHERAQREREAPGAVLRSMRDPGEWHLLMPLMGHHVYPVAHPMITGALARLLPAATHVRRAADLWIGLLLVWLLCELRLVMPRGARLADVLPTVLALLCPFVVVHLRAGYVDIVVGVLAALASLCLWRALWRGTALHWLAWTVVATVLCQTKQEGAVLLAAGSVTMTALAARHGRWSGRAAVWQVAVPLVNVGGWWLLTRALFGPDMPHALRSFAGVGLSRLPRFGWELARHALDVHTWGAAWGLLLGLALARRNPWWVLHIGLVLGLDAAAFVLGPPEVMDYLAQGTVMNRILLQVLVASLPFVLPPAPGE